MERITFIVKPVAAACNLRCRYCYNTMLWDDNAYCEKMSLETLEFLIAQAAKLDLHKIDFIWHGGEPLLAGIAFYEEAYRLQLHYLKEKRFSNAFQSNGTLINDEWAYFARQSHFTFGISLDGPEKINNYNRVFPSGEGSFQKIMKGVEILRRQGIEPGAIAVITKKSIEKAQEIMDFFTKNKLYKLNLSACAEKSRDQFNEFSITPSEWAQFMIEVFDRWIEDDNPDVKIQLLENLFQGLIGGKTTLCYCTKDCSSYVAVNSNGDLYLCGRFLGIEDFKLGNIAHTEISNILTTDRYQHFVRETSIVKKECRRCPWKLICNGGCTYYRFINGSIADHYYFCSSMKKLLSHMNFVIGGLKPAD